MAASGPAPAPGGADTFAWSFTMSPMLVGCVVVTGMPCLFRHEAYDCARETSFGSPLNDCALAWFRLAVVALRSWTDAEP